LFFDFNGFWRLNNVTRLTAKFDFQVRAKKIILKERDVIETNMKNFWKSSIALGDIANVLMFLKIATKWREIQKSKLNNSNQLSFSKPFYILFYRVVLFLNYLFVLPYLDILILLPIS